MSRALAALSILAITTLSFFVFPGHTYLEQDTQIYVPILENQWSGALANDLIVEHPHVSFTLYDELTNVLRWSTRLPLAFVLESEQFLFRAAGLAGIYLIALSFQVGAYAAVPITALWALGATITGPAVLTIEYEPTPRSFAVPLLFLAVGLALQHRYHGAGVASACAVLLHAPATWPFLAAAAAFIAGRKRSWMLLGYPLLALVLLAGIGSLQPSADQQSFLGHLGSGQEALQRMRAPYSYVSTWWAGLAWQYELLAAVAIVGLWRLRASREHWILLGGLVIAGLLSVPLSWLLLEQLHLSLVPQVQPARALLFVTGIATMIAALTGWKAVSAKRFIEAAVCFSSCLLVAVQLRLFAWPGWRIVSSLAVVAIAFTAATPRWRTAVSMLIAPLIAYGAGVSQLTHAGTPDLQNLAQWARVYAPGIYFFPEAGHGHAPGWFRANSLQPLYVDWKGGGQVNYLRAFSEQWSRRWKEVEVRGGVAERYSDLSINYLVYPRSVKTSLHLVFHNSSYWVYDLNVKI